MIEELHQEVHSRTALIAAVSASDYKTRNHIVWHHSAGITRYTIGPRNDGDWVKFNHQLSIVMGRIRKLPKEIK